MLTLCIPHGLQSTRLLCPWNSPGKNIGVGSHSLLQEIFPTPGLYLGLLHCSRVFTIWATREAPFLFKYAVKSQTHYSISAMPGNSLTNFRHSLPTLLPHVILIPSQWLILVIQITQKQGSYNFTPIIRNILMILFINKLNIFFFFGMEWKAWLATPTSFF